MCSIQSIKDANFSLLQRIKKVYIVNFDDLNKQMLNVFFALEEIFGFNINEEVYEIWNYQIRYQIKNSL